MHIHVLDQAVKSHHGEDDVDELIITKLKPLC